MSSGTLTALPMFNTGRHAIITNDIRDQALEDFMSSPDIFDGTVRFEGLKKILKEATDKVHVRNSHPRFNGDYSDYIVDKYNKHKKNLLYGLFGKKDSYRKINRSAAKVVGSNEGSINYCN